MLYIKSNTANAWLYSFVATIKRAKVVDKKVVPTHNVAIPILAIDGPTYIPENVKRPIKLSVNPINLPLFAFLLESPGSIVVFFQSI